MFKTKKQGFTLAEVLITLSIIGVVAALGLPQIVNNTRKEQYGATLGRAVEQIQLGAQNMIQAFNDESTDGSYAQDLSDLEQSFSFDLLATYAGADKIGEVEKFTANKFNGGSQMALRTGNKNVGVFSFKNFPAGFSILGYDPNPTKYTETYIMIDVNGINTKPNQYGKDIFKFKLKENGKLAPEGDASECPGTNGDDCAARVVKDGFKITYW